MGETAKGRSEAMRPLKRLGRKSRRAEIFALSIGGLNRPFAGSPFRRFVGAPVRLFLPGTPNLE
jgi:hypothetical protein